MAGTDKNEQAASVISRLREAFGGKPGAGATEAGLGADGLSGTRWERWFGDPWLAAKSVAEISDYYESLLDEMQGRGVSSARGFAAAATGDGMRPWALSHVGDLVNFLEGPDSEDLTEGENK